ncbi:MAG: ATP-binding protein [Desulfobulbaceae bacterium]|nr:ATP-binding protein [Desulfobulbaceae bacterium]MCK5545482.1 ATP-binding protein [Desulfobulbaceae bacterium]
MKRLIDKDLQAWKESAGRKALLLRGARQVGKTYSIRKLGYSFEHFLEVNFEAEPAVSQFFDDALYPESICEKLSAYYRIPITAGKTLLFFDEIQAAPRALQSIRFFYERLPGLHVAAAGSLLEFALEQIPSMGVGRIESFFLYPMSFPEFLMALDREAVLEMISKAGVTRPLDDIFHRQLVDLLKVYQLIGGLPEVVRNYIDTHDLNICMEILDNLLTTFQDDFAKYKKRAPVIRLGEVFQSIAYQAGCKFKYSHVNSQSGIREIKDALDMLVKAGLAYRVQHSSAQGIPLGAQANPKRYKVLPFDMGIHQRLLGLNLGEHLLADAISLVNKGSLAEVFAGLELIGSSSRRRRPELYYWHREARGSNAEVDYLVQKNENIIPVEVKSSTRGSMQSMKMYLDSHSTQYGIRLSLENFSSYDHIRVFPLYAAWRVS